jgi:hypothetical protein
MIAGYILECSRREFTIDSRCVTLSHFRGVLSLGFPSHGGMNEVRRPLPDWRGAPSCCRSAPIELSRWTVADQVVCAVPGPRLISGFLSGHGHSKVAFGCWCGTRAGILFDLPLFRVSVVSGTAKPTSMNQASDEMRYTTPRAGFARAAAVQECPSRAAAAARTTRRRTVSPVSRNHAAGSILQD